MDFASRRTAFWLLGAWLGLASVSVMAQAPPASVEMTPAALTFGILPIGGPAESLTAWEPLLQDMRVTLQRPINSISVSTYQGIETAIGKRHVDIAFLSGYLALDAVTLENMDVVAQMTRLDSSKGYYAVLIANRNGSIQSLNDVLNQPGHWRFARNERLSVSGYLVPEAQLFAARGLDSDTFFANVRVDSHENNALAVANGEVDLATNNTADLYLFHQHFPESYSNLRIIWRSTLIPHAVLVVRKDLPPALRQRITDFLTHYGKGNDRQAGRERQNLERIHGIASFVPADNTTLVPFADIEYQLQKRRAATAQWVSTAAKQARLDKISAEHKAVLRQLGAGPGSHPQPVNGGEQRTD